MKISSVEDKVLNACHRLNAEAYEQQVLALGKQLKHFAPCEKAEMLMQAIRTGAHFGTCHIKAVRTICPCHNSLDDRGLMGYEYDETYKLANYRHDLHVLYPRLYKQAHT